MESDTLIAPEGTITEPVEAISPEVVEESPAVEDVATDSGEQVEGTNDQPVADPLDILKTLKPDQLRERPEIAAILQEERRRAEQSANDRAKAQLAAQQAAERRQQASVENRRVQAQVAARVVAEAARQNRPLTQPEIDSIFQYGEAHATTVGVMNVANAMATYMAEKYPDFQADAADRAAMQMAIDTHDLDQMGRIQSAVLEKAALNKRGIDEQQIRLDERSKIEKEREELAKQEASVKTQKTAAATRNDPSRQPTRVSGTTATRSQWRSQAEFLRAAMNGTVQQPSDMTYRQWVAKETAGLPAQ